MPVSLTAPAEAAAPTAVAFNHVSLSFDNLVVLRDLSFRIPRGAMRMLLGASGSGKSVLLKLILGLLKPDSGTIEVNGQRIDNMREHDLLQVRADIGMVFQENALFDSLTVAENVGYRLVEERDMSAEQVRVRVEEVLGFIGLAEYTDRLPAELSGGQRRRVAIARAMAPQPGLLLFDDPITGLDPLVAMIVDNEIIKLRDLEDVTSILVTHQIRDAVYIATHQAVRDNGGVRFDQVDASRADEVKFMVLHEGRLHFEGSADELLASPDPYLRDYLQKTLPPW
jgi:phospholipid/cholesterol/gamma-HCH transport system ATP-binding protein